MPGYFDYCHMQSQLPVRRMRIDFSSAGAASVTLMLSAYGGKDEGLFVAAAAESQSFGIDIEVAQTCQGILTTVTCSRSYQCVVCELTFGDVLQQLQSHRALRRCSTSPKVNSHTTHW
jgi:hypothetical protein